MVCWGRLQICVYESQLPWSINCADYFVWISSCHHSLHAKHVGTTGLSPNLVHNSVETIIILLKEKLAWQYPRIRLELGHFFDLLGKNLGLKLSWILVQILTLPFANTSRAKESSTNIGFFPCLPLLRNSALFFPVDHFCDAIICMFSPTHPHKNHTVMDFILCCSDLFSRSQHFTNNSWEVCTSWQFITPSFSKMWMFS